MKRGPSVTGITILAILVGMATQSVRADGYRNPPESASSLGRIGGKIVHADDASAATINPANIAEMDRPEAMASFTVGYVKRSFDASYGVSEDTEDPWAYLPSVFGVMPLGEDGKYVLGIGITVPYGRSTDWGSDVVFGAASPYYADQSVISVNPVLATKLNDHVSVAVGVSVYQSDLKFKQAFPWSQLTMNPASPNGDAEFSGDGFGYGGNAAVTWHINDRHALALTYRSPFTIEYDGDFTVSETPAAAAMMGVTSRSDFETEIDYPTQVALGYGMQVSENVRIELDVEWIEASRNESMSIDIANNNVLLPSSEVAQNWDDNWTYGIGMDWSFSEHWTARAGYMYLETPTSTATTIPVAVEDNQSVISVGLGYDDERHSIDLAYAVGIFDTLTVDDNVSPAVNGDYDFTSHLVSIAYGYRF